GQRQPYADDRGHRTEEQERFGSDRKWSDSRGRGGRIRRTSTGSLAIAGYRSRPELHRWLDPGGHQQIVERSVRHGLEHPGGTSDVAVQRNVDRLDRVSRAGGRNRSRVPGRQLRGRARSVPVASERPAHRLRIAAAGGWGPYFDDRG